MKILLINPPIRTWAPPNCFPQGLGYVAQALRTEHDVKVLDLNTYYRDEKKRPELEFAIDWMLGEGSDSGYGAVGITGLITNYGYVKWLVSEIKKRNPDMPVVVGGPLGSSIPEIMLQKAGADICVVGEGELAAVELFRLLERGEKISGTWFPRHLIQNISALPLPAYDLFPTEVYADNPVGSTINRDKWGQGQAENTPRSMNILSSRGCAWNCTFCYHDYMGAKYRYRNPQSLFDEIIYLYHSYYIKFILMADDCFVTNRKNV